MLRWPIRLKLIVGLSVVVGMMLILMGASIFGLHSFHLSYLTLVDQMREIGASGGPDGLGCTACTLLVPNSPEEVDRAEAAGRSARSRLFGTYFNQLKKNTNQGSRVDSGTDELGLAFLIDDDLAAILSELDPSQPPPERLLPGTEYYVEHHPELLPPVKPATGLPSRIERLNETVMQLPKRLYEDFWAVLQMSQKQYQTSRIIVWISSLMVLGDALRADVAVPPVGSVSAAALAARRSPRGAGLVRLQDRPAVRRRDAGPGRSLQRHDGEDQRDLRRSRAAGSGTEPAARAVRAAGRRRLSGRRGGARDQQSAGVDRLLRRGARPSARAAARRRPTTPTRASWSTT